jgi:hypothetical protein
MMQKKLIKGLLLLLIVANIGCKEKKSQSQETPPYTIILEEYVNDSLPSLHSYSHAIYNDYIIMFGGRTNGLHSPGYFINRQNSNRIIYVINTNGWATPDKWTVKSMTSDTILITKSNAIDVRHFRANNAQFFQKENTLYLIGGLFGGIGDEKENPRTLPYLTAIDLPAIVSMVNDGKALPANSIRQISNEELSITGGEVEELNGQVKLVFGWKFNNGPVDLYSHKIKSFELKDDGKNVSIGDITFCNTCWDKITEPDTPSNGGFYRRRDGNMTPMIDPKTGNESLLYYAGVFKNGNTNFDNLVWIDADKADTSKGFSLRSNVYSCQLVPAFSMMRKQAYATMLGGMTNTNYNGKKINQFVLLDSSNAPFITPDPNNFTSVPFSNNVTTLVIDENKSYKQYLQESNFPKTTIPYYFDSTEVKAGENIFNGAEAALHWSPKVKNYLMKNGVLDYDKFAAANKDGATIGYLHGGIMSYVANALFAGNPAKQTRSSNRVFAVKIIPNK